MNNKTALYQHHLDAGAKMVDFYGWHMPLHYGSQVEEHHSVRQNAGVFDVSHMTVVDIDGLDVKHYLQRLLANDVARLTVSGKALYSAMLNEQGGVIDDLILYYLDETHYRMVVNSATREKDLAWLKHQSAGYSVAINERPELAMLSIQGPNAKQKSASFFNSIQNEIVSELTPFFGVHAGDYFIATTGYTGESGYEIILEQHQAGELWQRILDSGVAPAGLGARDTLRIEAGMNLYGQDMNESISPLAANMAWTISWEPENRQFIGREALERLRQVGHDKLVGLAMTQRGVLRAGMDVLAKDQQGNELKGIITSGTFSPTLGHAIALARVPPTIGTKAEVVMRGKRTEASIVPPCFVRHGKPTF